MRRQRFPNALAICGVVTILAGTLLAQIPATGDTRRVVEPRYPRLCGILVARFTSAERSSPPTEDDTSRLQTALNQCAGTGRAVLLLSTPSEDAFFSRSLSLEGEGLIVGPGTRLYGNDGYSNELLSIAGTNPSLMGPGTIDGRGDLISGTPRLINSKNAENLIVYNLTLKHAGKEHLYVEGGRNFTAWGVTIATPANTHNTDGIDVDSLTNATVIHSSIEDGDDGVAIKTNSGPAADITVGENKFYGTHGISIGSQTMYGVRNVLWEDNQLFGTDQFGNVSSDNNGIRIKSDLDCGGLVKRITYRKTRLIGVKHLLVFNPYYGSCSGTPGIPVYEDILVDGVTATDSASGAYSRFQGYDASNPLRLYLANIILDSVAQQNSQYAIVGLDNSNITPAGPDVTTFPFTLHHKQTFFPAPGMRFVPFQSSAAARSSPPCSATCRDAEAE